MKKLNGMTLDQLANFALDTRNKLDERICAANLTKSRMGLGSVKNKAELQTFIKEMEG